LCEERSDELQGSSLEERRYGEDRSDELKVLSWREMGGMARSEATR